MSDRPTHQNSQNNSKNFGSSSSSLNSSTSSVTAAATGAANGNNLNFLAAQQQQQQRGRQSSATINRQAGGNPNDFISFLNASTNGPTQINSQSPNNSNGSTGSAANTNALNRLETIRQYYMQLSNNLRLITQQLQSPDLTASRRQALLMEQARANAAMQEFTEKILKPISASKQQQAQAQAQAQTQQQQPQRPPFTSTAQMMFQGRPATTQQPQPQSTQMKSTPPSTAPTSNFMAPQIPQGTQPQSQRPPQMNSSVNLYSQSGLGMIRPIINTATPSSGTRSSTATNFRPNGPLPIPSAPQSVPPMPAGSPQRSFRPPTAVNVPISQLNTNMNQPINTSPAGLIAPGTPKSQQQFIVNRQTYLMTAQQHQTSVAQQQLLFQQRLSLFSRDPTNNSPPGKKRVKVSGRGAAPVLALPPVSQFNRQISSPVNGKVQNFPSNSAANVTNFPSFNVRTTSFPSSYLIGPKLSDLAKQFKLELTEGAERILLRIADEFIDSLARKSILFASHRKRKLPHSNNLPVTTNGKPKKGSISQSHTTESVDEFGSELTVTVEDLMLGLDEVINYQPAGNGSIENCRPMIKKGKETTSSVNAGISASLNVNVNNNTDNPNTTSSTTSVSNHQHRLTMVKKHSSLYQNY